MLVVFNLLPRHRKLILQLDNNDDNYAPTWIVVMGGELDSLKKLNDVSVDQFVFCD